MSRVVLVDLTGSRLGEGWRGARLDGDWPEDWSDERLRGGAAALYGVSAAQVEVRHEADMPESLAERSSTLRSA